MFNATVKGNVRCNGLLPSNPGGMAKRGIHVNSGVMPPNRVHLHGYGQHNITTDTKLKFSDRLKAYLSTDGLRSDASEVDDPYTFSDSEVVKPVVVATATPTTTPTTKCVVKTTSSSDSNSISRNSRVVNHVSNHHYQQQQQPAAAAVPQPQQHLHHVDVSGGVNKSELLNTLVTTTTTTTLGSGKTMSRLQAQIARNKVTVKHNRSSPDLKFEKNHHYDKSTKHSIIGLVNNVNSISNRSSHGGVPCNKRLPPSGKPMPAHLRARRTSVKGATHHEGSLQRIPPPPPPPVHAATIAALTTTTTSAGSNTTNTSISGSSSVTTSTTHVNGAGGTSLVWHAPQPYGPFLGSRTSTDSLITDSDEEDIYPVYQKHWFSKELEFLSNDEAPRALRLELTRTELKRQLLQMKRSKIGQYRTSALINPQSNRSQSSGISSSSSSTNLNHPNTSNHPPSAARSYVLEVAQQLANARRRRRRWHSPTKGAATATGIMASRNCERDECNRPALPCTKHCAIHIMDNSDQVLFDHCTAKFADNTQCSVPVFDITHELPLCIEHARKRDNYNRMCLEIKPKKPRRKIKPSAMIRPQKRNKKRKRSQKSPDLSHNTLIAATTTTTNHVTEVTELNICETSSAYESSEEVAMSTLSDSEFVTIKTEDHIVDQDVVEQVLAMQDEVVGDLEETDFTNVLNQIPPDEFNDLFAVDRNGEYEPSREETEELERALEAVDEDVKSLEKLTQTQGLLDSLLDEHTLVESLVQIPDVFHNGYDGVQCVESPSSQQSSSPSRPLHSSFHHPVLHHGVDVIMPVQSQAHAPS